MLRDVLNDTDKVQFQCSYMSRIKPVNTGWVEHRCTNNIDLFFFFHILVYVWNEFVI